MKAKLLLTLVLITMVIISNAQQTKQWLDMLENHPTKELQLDQKNSKDEFLKYDFSTLMVPRTDFLGFIGTDFRRIKVYFSSIVKDKSNPETYHVTGATIVKNNKCDFEGTVKVKFIRKYINGERTIDNRFNSKRIMNQGVLIGEYLFKENPNQKHVGTFEGIMALSWYIDEFDILYYDDLELMADGYSNNQYVGTWIMYNSPKGKPCNWGEYRIPMSGDLDQGAGEFVPNPKYYDMGWK